MARGLYPAPSSLLRQSSCKRQAKVSMNMSKVNKEATGLEVANSRGGIGGLMLMFELRKKIITFRDILHLPPCANATAIAELVVRTLEDLKKLYPSILPNIEESKEVSLQQEMSNLYEALKSIGDVWDNNRMLVADSVHSADVSSNATNSKQLGGRVIEELDNMIKTARQNFDVKHEDEKSNKDVLREMAADIKNTCSSPASPNSVPPGLKKPSAVADASNPLPTLLQTVEKCISTDICPVVSLQGTVPVKEGRKKADEQTENFSKAKSTTEGSPRIATNEVTSSPKSGINPKSNLSDMLNARRPKEASRSLSLPSIPTSPVPLAAPRPPPPPTVGVSRLNGTAPPPPPPPGLGVRKFPSLKRSNSKLRRSNHMGNLYRNLKRKLEGSNVTDAISNKINRRVGGLTSIKQGMAAALAEMTKRSAYFHQIEEDVHKHSEMIMKLGDDICSFKTKDMAELQKFRRDVEKHLEELSDETQVLARFEDFPTKKLESLRIAAALHSKLEGIAFTLEHWKTGPPVEMMLDKVERYFNKIKVDIELLDRSKDEDSKHLRSHDIDFDFNILIRIKELMVDVSSACMELALKERREATEGKRKALTKLLWRAFQLAFRVYTFAGGQDERADSLTKELGRVLHSDA
ncbi:uncharacterized protein [Coffea arabica]|uniref:Uncharacterized protein n=1 Tax=Coffea arabica TaxID=13443 RepID=A0A6P6S949_COFAR|nr:uncharacterized protein At4g04980-like [Coffea arabica]